MDAATLVQALAVAWGGVQLYPDPAAVPAFTQAVDTMGEFADSSVVLTVGVDGFEVDSELLATSHGAADRLVQALFASRVETVRVVAAPTPEEVIRFFVEVGDVEHAQELDLPDRLEQAGLLAIQVRCRDLLEDRDADQDEITRHVERDSEVQALFEPESVRRIAELVMQTGGPEAAAREFVDLFRSAYGRVTVDDPAGLERVVQTFVDAFFRIDYSYRPPVFEAIIELREEPAFQNFLDQLSADELADLAGRVNNSALPLLVEYARVVTGLQGRDPGLVAKIMGEQRGAEARGAVAGTIGVQLAEFLTVGPTRDASVDVIAAEVEALADQPRQGSTVLGDLFEIEERDDRLQRLLRIWVAKMNRAIKSREFSEAIEWLAVLRGAEVDNGLVDEAYRYLATDEVLEILTTGESDDSDMQDELLQELSKRAGDRVLEQLATEEDPGRRHMLIDVVTEIARVDVHAVLPALDDPRWYVVRNIAIALGRSGQKAAADPLAGLVHHDDHRVRIEALRALLLCLGPAAVEYLTESLADEHTRVRAAATYLLATLDDERVIPALGSALGNESWPVEARVAAIQALGRRPNEAAGELLRQMAATKVRFSQSARVLRSAARDALRSSDG